MHLHLNKNEVDILNRPINGNGGFQSLIRELQNRLDLTGALEITVRDIEKLRRYAFDYKNGGWQGRILGAFSRSLGSDLKGFNP